MMSPPIKPKEEVRGAYPDLDPAVEAGFLKMDGCAVVEQSWEELAPRLGTQPSGLFNLDMDCISGTGTLDNGMDGGQLTMDPAATSTVDLAELFPDLTDILSGPAPATGLEAGEEEGLSPLVPGGVAEEGACSLSVARPHPAAPCEVESVVVLEVGRREQLPSTSSCVSEASDYEDGLSPAEVDSALEHFFNEFIDLSNMVNNQAEAAGPTATVDAAAVRCLPDDTTNGNASLLWKIPDVETSSPACSTPSAPKRVKIENEESEEEEETCGPSKKARSAKRAARDPEEVYRQRRVKNNLACKRARQNRKKRDTDLARTAKELEAENARLRVKIAELTEVAELSRKALVEVFAK